MADRTCSVCNKTFKYPKYLREHRARKTPCAPILEDEDFSTEIFKDPGLAQKRCRFCGRIFATYTSMRRHVRNSCKIAPTAKNGGEGMELLYEHTVRRQEARIAKIEAQNSEMLSLMRQFAGAAVNVEGDNARIAIDNSQNIVINVFGQESLAKVTPASVKEILDKALAGSVSVAAITTEAVLETAMVVYSDPETPENLTCYIPNKKTGDAMVHGESGWEVKPVTLILPPMAKKSVDAMFDNQPFEDAGKYEGLMKELRDSETKYTTGLGLRPILVRNKALMEQALGKLPVVGSE